MILPEEYAIRKYLSIFIAIGMCCVNGMYIPNISKNEGNLLQFAVLGIILAALILRLGILRDDHGANEESSRDPEIVMGNTLLSLIVLSCVSWVLVTIFGVREVIRVPEMEENILTYIPAIFMPVIGFLSIFVDIFAILNLIAFLVGLLLNLFAIVVNACVAIMVTGIGGMIIFWAFMRIEKILWFICKAVLLPDKSVSY